MLRSTSHCKCSRIATAGDLHGNATAMNFEARNECTNKLLAHGSVTRSEMAQVRLA